MKKNIILFALAVAGTAAGYWGFDAALATFVHDHLPFPDIISGEVPDTLQQIVTLVTVTALLFYGYLRWKKIDSALTRASLSLACVSPFAYAAKTILKFAFGRASTVYWLTTGTSLKFHFFEGHGEYTGFPSGHMAVFTAILAVVAAHYPRLRIVCVSLLVCLAAALIATGYHFLSDVLAGTYLGWLVFKITEQGTRGETQRLGVPE
jgi:membrane-associated phospholipid phosphatase